MKPVPSNASSLKLAKMALSFAYNDAISNNPDSWRFTLSALHLVATVAERYGHRVDDKSLASSMTFLCEVDDEKSASENCNICLRAIRSAKDFISDIEEL